MNAPIDRHPWNHSFVPSVPATAPTTIGEEQRNAFLDDGYFVLDGVLEPGELAELTGELDALEAVVDEFLGTQDGGRFHIAEQGAITFSPHAVLNSPAARALAHHRTLVGLGRDLLGPDVNLYWDQAVYKKTEKQRRFPWHQDNGYTYVEPQLYLTCWLALTDATVDNGCPQVVPGAHRSRDPATPLGRPHRLAVLRRPARRASGPSARRRGRHLLVGHAPYDRSQHDRGGPQGVHHPVRRGRHRDARRVIPTRVHRSVGSARTTPTGSTRSCATGSRSARDVDEWLPRRCVHRGGDLGAGHRRTGRCRR